MAFRSFLLVQLLLQAAAEPSPVAMPSLALVADDACRNGISPEEEGDAGACAGALVQFRGQRVDKDQGAIDSTAKENKTNPIVNTPGCGCDWIPQDDCKNFDNCATSCRKANPWGPCTNKPIPVGPPIDPNRQCLEVFWGGESWSQVKYRLRLANCKEGDANQLFWANYDKYQIVWNNLCLVSFVGNGMEVGFDTCFGDSNSIFDFNQTFQRTGYSEGPICQCRCQRFGECPIPCSSNAACLFVQGDDIVGITPTNATFFWNE